MKCLSFSNFCDWKSGLPSAVFSICSASIHVLLAFRVSIEISVFYTRPACIYHLLFFSHCLFYYFLFILCLDYYIPYRIFFRPILFGVLCDSYSWIGNSFFKLGNIFLWSCWKNFLCLWPGFHLLPLFLFFLDLVFSIQSQISWMISAWDNFRFIIFWQRLLIFSVLASWLEILSSISYILMVTLISELLNF